jgi:hypothetical protein
MMMIDSCACNDVAYCTVQLVASQDTKYPSKQSLYYRAVLEGIYHDLK